jgi:hypothetical protein
MPHANGQMHARGQFFMLDSSEGPLWSRYSSAFDDRNNDPATFIVFLHDVSTFVLSRSHVDAQTKKLDWLLVCPE